MDVDCASIKIQRWYRKVKIRRETVRNDVDLFLREHSDGAVPGLDLFTIGSKLCKVYNKSIDRNRFLTFCKVILKSMESSETKIWYVSVALKAQHSVHFIQQVKWILLEACKSLRYLKPGMPKDEPFINTYLTTFVILTDYTLWKMTSKGGDALKPVLHQLCTSFIVYLMDNDLFTYLHELLLTGLSFPKPRLKGHSLQAVMGLRALALCGFSDKCLSLFLSHILVVPACIWHLNKLYPEGVTRLVKVNLVSRCMQYLHCESQVTELWKRSKTEILALFGNLLQLKHIHLLHETDSEVEISIFQDVMNMLLSSIKHERKAVTTATWHLLFGWSDQFLDKRLLDCLPHLHQQLQLLWNFLIVNTLFEPVLLLDISETTKTAKSKGFSLKTLVSSTVLIKMDKVSIDRIYSASKFFQLCVTAIPKMSTEILIGLSCNHRLPSRLWYFICNVIGVHVKDSVPAMLSPETDRYAPILMIICQITQYLLSVLDDKELFEDQKFFPLHDLNRLTLYLNNLIYTCVWERSLMMDTSSLTNSTVTLLALLLQRNRRTNFMTEQELQIRGLRISTFTSEFKMRVPRAMELLHHIPHIIPHSKRVEIFYEYIKADKAEHGIGSGHSRTPATYITIHRSNLLESGYAQLSSLPALAIKGVIRVNFVNIQGLDEAGIDEMGVFKEFLEDTIKQVFDPSLSLFKTNNDGCLYPSPLSMVHDNHVSLLEFTGKMLGKAVYEGIVVDVPFAIFFLRHLIKQPHNLLYSSLDELYSMDPELSKSLHFIKHYEGDFDDLCLTFSFEEEFLGKHVTHELIPGGSVVPVTSDNSISYVHHVAHYKMATQLKVQISAFLKGFHSIINPQWMAIFNPEEFQRVISGDDSDLDVDNLRKHTQYFGGFHDKHAVIIWLWDVIKKDFSPSEKAAFLKFVTSCSRPPLLGFSQLDPPFSIRRVDTSDEEESISISRSVRSFFHIKSSHTDRLPTSSTCFNLLKLPDYSSKKILREKLLFSISANAGFELS